MVSASPRWGAGRGAVGGTLKASAWARHCSRARDTSLSLVGEEGPGLAEEVSTKGPRGGISGPCVPVAARAAADDLQKNEHACFLIEFQVWTLSFEFPLIATCHRIYCFSLDFPLTI